MQGTRFFHFHLTFYLTSLTHIRPHLFILIAFYLFVFSSATTSNRNYDYLNHNSSSYNHHNINNETSNNHHNINQAAFINHHNINRAAFINLHIIIYAAFNNQHNINHAAANNHQK